MESTVLTNVQQVVPGLHQLELGFVNAYVVELADGLTLVDAGFPGDADSIVAGLASLGHGVEALSRIVISHGHLDHLGSAAELRRRSGAQILLSEVDAGPVRQGLAGHGTMHVLEGYEDLVAGQLADPDFRRRSGGRNSSEPMEIDAFEPDAFLVPGAAVPGWPGTAVVAAPGHCLGQVAILWREHGGCLFTGDAAVNFGAVGIAPVGEDFTASRASFATLAGLDFTVALFGHGAPLVEDAAAAFRASG